MFTSIKLFHILVGAAGLSALALFICATASRLEGQVYAEMAQRKATLQALASHSWAAHLLVAFIPRRVQWSGGEKFTLILLVVVNAALVVVCPLLAYGWLGHLPVSAVIRKLSDTLWLLFLMPATALMVLNICRMAVIAFQLHLATEVAEKVRLAHTLFQAVKGLFTLLSRKSAQRPTAR